MDYEKAYKEALERAKEFQKSKEGLCVLTAESIFPELAESEDEKIRKGLIDIFNTALGQDFLQRKAGLNEKEVIAYLEKQKEQKPAENEKVEMTEFEQSVYDLCPVLGIEEAKATASDLLELAKQALLKTGKVVLSSNYPEGCSFEDGFHLGYTEGFNAKQEQKPAEWKPTEEQFNYLAKAIMTLGEEGDCKTAGVLSEIRKGLKCSFPDWKVSPDYPEEGCNVSLNGEVKKIQEWSEEDEKMIERLITRLNWITYNTRTDGTSPNITFFDEIAWLKSLRPSWKPGEEQMSMLLAVIRDPNNAGSESCFLALQSLYEDLKKLM